MLWRHSEGPTWGRTTDAQGSSPRQEYKGGQMAAPLHQQQLRLQLLSVPRPPPLPRPRLLGVERILPPSLSHEGLMVPTGHLEIAGQGQVRVPSSTVEGRPQRPRRSREAQGAWGRPGLEAASYWPSRAAEWPQVFSLPRLRSFLFPEAPGGLASHPS